MGLAALACASCTPPHRHAQNHDLRRVSSLECPAEQGDLALKSGGSGQARCVYATDNGAQVTLELIDLGDADADAALRPMEALLKAEIPGAADQPGPDKAANHAEAHPTGGDDQDRVDLDLPGLHIHTHGDGRADVDTAGVHVHADDTGGRHTGKAEVSVGGGVRIDAHDGGAQIRIAEEGSGIRLNYVLESDAAGPHGYRVGAYEARGPSGGPLVVAQILGKDKESDDLRHDVHQLLKLNVGG
jgi:hypothetical protein